MRIIINRTIYWQVDLLILMRKMSIYCLIYQLQRSRTMSKDEYQKLSGRETGYGGWGHNRRKKGMQTFYLRDYSEYIKYTNRHATTSLSSREITCLLVTFAPSQSPTPSMSSDVSSPVDDPHDHTLWSTAAMADHFLSRNMHQQLQTIDTTLPLSPRG